jgi:hypothetical protein
MEVAQFLKTMLAWLFYKFNSHWNLTNIYSRCIVNVGIFFFSFPLYIILFEEENKWVCWCPSKRRTNHAFLPFWSCSSSARVRLRPTRPAEDDLENARRWKMRTARHLENGRVTTHNRGVFFGGKVAENAVVASLNLFSYAAGCCWSPGVPVLPLRVVIAIRVDCVSCIHFSLGTSLLHTRNPNI